MAEYIDVTGFESSNPNPLEVEFNFESNFESKESNFESTESNLEEPTNKCFIYMQDSCLDFPLSKVSTGSALGVSDTTINNWIKALKTVGINCLDSKGKITLEGFERLKAVAEAKAEGVSLAEYLEGLNTRIAVYEEPLAINPIDADSYIERSNIAITTLQAEVTGISSLVVDLATTANKAERMLINQAKMQGAKTGIARAKARYTAMIDAENRLLSQLAEELESDL